MSRELFEAFGMLGVGVGLTAFFHRKLQPALVRLAASAADPMRAAARRSRAAKGLDPNRVAQR